MATAWTVEGPTMNALNGEGNGQAGLRILIVEDQVDCAESMALLLRLYGHEVEVVPNGSAALATAKAHPPDVVLLDIGLPGGMDGWEVAPLLKQQAVGKQPLLIAVTGFGQEADRRHSAESGIDLHLTKPVDPYQLRVLLHRFQAILAR